MHRLQLIICAAVAAFGISACGSSDGGGCADDYDCPGSQRCITGACEEFVCATDKDCVDNSLRCIRNQCVGANTVPPDASGAPVSTDI